MVDGAGRVLPDISVHGHAHASGFSPSLPSSHKNKSLIHSAALKHADRRRTTRDV